MPRDSQGNTNPLPGTIVQTGDTILPSQHNPAIVDIYAMMTQSLSRDGQGGMRAPLAMNGFPVRNVGPAEQPNDAVPLSQFQAGTPVGAVVDFAGVTPPNTWMLCFGQAIEISAYPEFVAACYVGNTLNATAGFGYRTTSQTDPSANRSTSGQFIVLPDLRGRVGAGVDNMGGTDSGRLSFNGSQRLIIGGGIGTDAHVLTQSQIPSHSHGVNDPGHFHNVQGAFSPVAGPSGSTSGTVTLGGVTSTNTTGISIQNTGGDLPHTNTQPTLIINKIIKVSY